MPPSNSLPIYLVSGGAGNSGKELLETVLVQFPEHRATVISMPYVRRSDQVAELVAQAAKSGGLIVHTMVDAQLRAELVAQAAAHGLRSIDLMGPLLDCLTEVLGRPPVGQPGLYRQLHQDYFERVGAIEFSLDHDDGKNRQDWPQADIVLVGISRAGKTPLSMYLAVQGWKVANYPLVAELPLPAELFQLNPNRVIGLTIEPGQLVHYRQKRQQGLGAAGPTNYTNPAKIFAEVEAARKLFRQNGFAIVDVTDKPIEVSADEIITLLTRRGQLPRL
jgi:regulator of PEP synthase PpsR (kinase-PPPase family)